MHSDKIIAQYRSHSSRHITLIDIGINASTAFYFTRWKDSASRLTLMIA
jgi:hypothetical protein